MNSILQNYLENKRAIGGRQRLDLAPDELAKICDALEQVELIDELRAEEGHEVTICHDNPDFHGPNCAVAWAGNFGESFVQCYGDTVADALRAAVAVKNSEPPPPPEDRKPRQPGALKRAWLFFFGKENGFGDGGR